MTRLQITSDTNVKEIIELTRDSYTIGRSDTCSIQLSDARSSRSHARVYSEDSEYFIIDVGSANGTLVNNSKIESKTPYKLTNDDTISIGQTNIIISEIPQKHTDISQSEFMPYSDTGVLFDTSSDSDYELSATLDASMSLAQLSEEDSYDSETMAKALKRMEAMCIISEAVGNIMNIDELMNKVIETVFGIFPKADRSFILLKKGERYIPVAARTRASQDINLKELKISTTVLKTCTDKMMSILSNNTAEDERFNDAMSIAELAIDSFICSPLVVNDEVLGIIQVEGETGAEEFDETDLQIVTGISGQIAIAVKNISLAREIEKESAQRANLQRYFSPNMVDMLVNGDINTELGGKQYTGTVFFSDIIGFTAMSEKMNAGEVVTNLNRYFTIMQNLIYKNRGNVDKFGGDAIMAFWSVPHRVEDDELNAVLTGIQMQGELYPFNLELKAEDISTIYMGIGINTGDFVAGNIGSEDKIEFTLIGDNVNLAARIEARAGKTQVMCSHETYDRISNSVSSVELPQVMFKGKSAPQSTFSIRALESEKGRMLANIPVKVIEDDNTLSDEFYMLTEIRSTDSGKEIVVSADRDFAVSDRINLRCCLNEYHDRIELSGTVRHFEPKESLSGKEYKMYILNSVEGEKFAEIFTPGYNYKTELSWEEMPREREVEGN